MFEKPSKADFFTKVQRTPKHVLAGFEHISHNRFDKILPSMSWEMFEKPSKADFSRRYSAPQNTFWLVLNTFLRIDFETFICHVKIDCFKTAANGKKHFFSQVSWARKNCFWAIFCHTANNSFEKWFSRGWRLLSKKVAIYTFALSCFCVKTSCKIDCEM